MTALNLLSSTTVIGWKSAPIQRVIQAISAFGRSPLGECFVVLFRESACLMGLPGVKLWFGWYTFVVSICLCIVSKWLWIFVGSFPSTLISLHARNLYFLSMWLTNIQEYILSLERPWYGTQVCFLGTMGWKDDWEVEVKCDG